MNEFITIFWCLLLTRTHGVPSSVNWDVGPSDVGSAGRGQESDDGCHFCYIANPTKGVCCLAVLQILKILQKLAQVLQIRERADKLPFHTARHSFRPFCGLL